MIVKICLGSVGQPQELRGSTPDKTNSASAPKPASGESTEQTSDLKPTSTEEGQLASVNNAKIPAYAKVYVAPMLGGFENYIIAGLRNKKVPLTVLVDRSKADYEISGVSDSEKAGWPKCCSWAHRIPTSRPASKWPTWRRERSFSATPSTQDQLGARPAERRREACAKHIKQIVVD